MDFLRKDWLPGLAAELLNRKDGVPLVFESGTQARGIYSERGIEEANSEFARFFRLLIDGWLDSGRNNLGYEEPTNRNLNGRLPDSDEPLMFVLAEWVRRNVRPALMGTGKITYLDNPPTLSADFEPGDFGREHAVYWFLALLDSPDAHRLARCANPRCGSYYARRRRRKREIKRGPFCDNCAGAASAIRTNASRERRKSALIQIAADVWPAKWQQTSRFKSLSDYVAAKVNGRQKGRLMTVTGKWVTQNRNKIGMELERRRNAAS